MSEDNLRAPSLPSADSLRRLAVSESGFVFDPVSGNNFTVNDTGLVLLRLLQKQQDFERLIKELQQDYEASPADIERDAIEFIGMLREFMGE